MEFQKEITRCGAPLYVFPMKHATSIALGVLIHAGTRDELAHEAGLAHALEHMLFQGNDRLPDSRSISSEIELIGGNINASTGKEYTFYSRVVPDDALPVAADSLASQLHTSKFRTEDLKEMRNIVREIGMADDHPTKFCARKFYAHILGDHPLGKVTLGTKESVLGFTRDDFLGFNERYYHAGNYAFIVVGKTTMSKALKAFNKAFTYPSSRPKNARFAASVTPAPDRRLVLNRSIEQAELFFGTLIGGSADKDTKALDFYATMLSGGMSFPLFQEIRDRRLLCYHVHAGVDDYADLGIFELYISTDPERVQEAVRSIHEVVATSCTDELFAHARSHLLGDHKVNLYASPEALMYRAASDIIETGDPISPAKIKEEIESQTLSAVQSAVEKYLLDESTYAYTLLAPEGAKLS